MITIICSVAADFFRGKNEHFSIRPIDINIILQAPAWITETLMFSLLVKDGSLKFVEDGNKKQLENDPTEGLNAEGKAVEVEEVPAEEAPVEEKPKKTTRKRKADA